MNNGLISQMRAKFYDYMEKRFGTKSRMMFLIYEHEIMNSSWRINSKVAQ